ncbi:MAG: FAD-dependent oxidoreductase [Henriciella sp.]|nr:FAD-dependent oxidoreductase [Henriciella sp.]
MNIAIIGAGLAGLHLASQLASAHTVTVFEKARGPGGRMSTRRAAPYAFDHGAQYFTAATQAFRDFLAPFLEDGTVAAWPDAIELSGGAVVSDKQKYAAAPGMNAICKTLAAGLDVRTGARIETLQRAPDGWHVQIASGETEGPFDWVISTAPAPQTAALLPDDFGPKERLAEVEMLGCFTLMLGFEAPPAITWSAQKIGNSPVGWMAMNSEKPGREGAASLVVQANNTWAEAHLEDDPAAVISTLLNAASEYADQDLSTAPHQVLHRWRYAATRTPAGEAFLKDDALQLAACGDWCLGSKVEAAFLSADALAKDLL